MMIPTRHRRNCLLSGMAKGFLFIVVSSIFLASCQTPGLVLKNQIPLVKDKPYDGTQQTMDYQLTYHYSYRKGNPAGTIDFSGNLIPRRGLYTFTLRLHLLNSSGDVLATSVLYAPGSGHGAARTSIQKQIEVPPETTAIAFSHRAVEPPLYF